MATQYHPIRRVLIVARDYRYSPLTGHLKTITRIAESLRVDTISFALSTTEESTEPRRLTTILRRSKNLRHIMLETYKPEKREAEIDQKFHLLTANDQKEFRRHFASSFEPGISGKKKRLLLELPERQFSDKGLILICGEISMLKCNGKRRAHVEDPFALCRRLKVGQVIFAPAHTYMRRPEQKRKRIALSENGRTVISVWNKNSYVGREPMLPWGIYRNGRDITAQVKPVNHFISSRPDIQMGLVEI